MKRLLCLISNMDTGGAETFLMKIYRTLDKSKYQMDFCTNVDKACFYENEIRSLGGRMFHIPPKSRNLKDFKKELNTLIQNEHYEYVLRVTSNAAGFMDLKIAKHAGARICSARSSNSSDGRSLKAQFIHRLGRLFYTKFVDVKFAPSDLAAVYTFGKKAVKNGDVHFLNNGVDLDAFYFDETGRKEIRREFKITEDITVIGHIGRLAVQKNHTFLLDIFREIHKKNKNTILLLVGEGELEKEIKNKIRELELSDYVIFAGVRPDIPQILSAMDVFVFPSFYEGMPNTVIEAQATGLPCLISDTITRQAEITGLVSYLSLKATADIWAEKAISFVRTKRKNTKKDFMDRYYDIDSVANQFVRLVFGE